MALFLIISVPAFKRRAICPFIHSKSMLFTIFEVAREGLSIAVPHGAISSYLVAGEVAFVRPLFLKTVFSSAIFFSPDELSLVAAHPAAFCPDLSSSAIRIVTCPLTFIAIAAFFKDECSMAFCLFLGKLAFIIPALRTYKATFSVGNSLRKVAIIETAVTVQQSPLSAGQSISPLPIGIIDKSFMVDGVGSWLSHSFRRDEASRVLKRLEFALYFDHLRVKFWEAVDRYKVAHVFNVILRRRLLELRLIFGAAIE